MGDGDKRIPTSDYINQIKSNPNPKTTTRTRLNPNNVDMHIGIVKVMASKISQTILWRHISMQGRRLGPDTGKSFAWAGSGIKSGILPVSIVTKWDIVISLDFRRESLGLYWDLMSRSYIPRHVPVWNLRINWWRVMLSRVVMGFVDAVRILYLTLHGPISYGLRDTVPMEVLLVITRHMWDLKGGING